MKVVPATAVLRAAAVVRNVRRVGAHSEGNMEIAPAIRAFEGDGITADLGPQALQGVRLE